MYEQLDNEFFCLIFLVALLINNLAFVVFAKSSSTSISELLFNIWLLYN